MKTLFYYTAFISFFTLFTSCSKEDIGVPTIGTDVSNMGREVMSESDARKSKTGITTYSSSQVNMGNGHARSFVKVSSSNAVLSAGIELTPYAFTGLGYNQQQKFRIPFNKKATGLMPFDHVEVVWNPINNKPSGDYNTMHLDFVFYTISSSEQDAIPAYASNPAGFDNNPPAGHLPTDYAKSAAGIEKMGAIWYHTDPPVMNYGAFVHSLQYGSYNGRVNFLAVSAAYNAIISTNSYKVPFSQPAYFAKDAYYPTSYAIYRNAATGDYVISFEDMVMR